MKNGSRSEAKQIHASGHFLNAFLYVTRLRGAVGGRVCRVESDRDPRVALSSLWDSDNMIRTQISLDEQEYDLAKKEAQSLGIPVAEFVRRAVREALPPQGAGARLEEVSKNITK